MDFYMVWQNLIKFPDCYELCKWVGFLTHDLTKFNPIFIPHGFWYLSMSLVIGWEDGGKRAAADSQPLRIKTGFVTKERR